MGIIGTIIISFIAGLSRQVSGAGRQRAVGLYPGDAAWHRGCVRCYLSRSGHRLVSGR